MLIVMSMTTFYLERFLRAPVFIDTICQATNFSVAHSAYIFNNTAFASQENQAMVHLAQRYNGPSHIQVSNLFFFNNQFGGPGNQAMFDCVMSSWAVCYSNVANSLESSNIAINSFNYTSNNNFRPISAVSPTVGDGTNLSGFASFLSVPGGFNVDVLGNSRPTNGAWDIGAYQFSAMSIGPALWNAGLRIVTVP